MAKIKQWFLFKINDYVTYVKKFETKIKARIKFQMKNKFHINQW